jgi:hypothetical protein
LRLDEHCPRLDDQRLPNDHRWSRNAADVNATEHTWLTEFHGHTDIPGVGGGHHRSSG